MVVALLLCVAASAIAGQVSPGVVFYANTPDEGYGSWRTKVRVLAPLDASAVFRAGVPVQSSPQLGPVTVEKGGAWAGSIGWAGIGTLDAPTSGDAAMLLEYKKDDFYRALTLHAITFRFDRDNDRLRMGAYRGHIAVTATSKAKTPSEITVLVYDSTGKVVDAFYIDLRPSAVVQAEYNGLGSGGAYSLQAVPGCHGIGGGSCEVVPLAYLFATNDDGALGASIEADYGTVINTATNAAARVADENAIVQRIGAPNPDHPERVPRLAESKYTNAVKRKLALPESASDAEVDAKLASIEEMK
jgi:hypothetical protein